MVFFFLIIFLIEKALNEHEYHRRLRASQPNVIHVIEHLFHTN